jgi:hypothetical protein
MIRLATVVNTVAIFMTIATVLGNGKSRLELDLEKIKTKTTVYGCNALYRTFTPHYLIATDNGIATEIQDSGYSKTNTFYTRNPMSDTGAKKITLNFGYSSGPVALSYAVDHKHDTIFLVGFDLKGDDGKFNNVYAGTSNYKSVGATETFFGNWLKQIENIVKSNPTVKFIRVNPWQGYTPVEWTRLKNFRSIDSKQFHSMINI